jgi:hypothetical protein
VWFILDTRPIVVNGMVYIGQLVLFNNQQFYLLESTTVQQESVVHNYAKLTKKAGLSQPLIKTKGHITAQCLNQNI